MKTEIITCDVCKSSEKVIENKSMQVIFHTDQTEGRSVKPYLSIEQFDVCEKCIDTVLKGNYIHGDGAQGYNNYSFAKIKP